jgi:hypothetical protein
MPEFSPDLPTEHAQPYDDWDQFAIWDNNLTGREGYVDSGVHPPLPGEEGFDGYAVELDDVAGSHESAPADMRERILAELPVATIGNADPLNPENLEYPNVLFHGAHRNFDLDDSKDYRTAPQATGARTGRGLYCAAEPVAATFGGEMTTAILPKEATVLDLTSPMAERSLPTDFRQAFIAFQEDKLEVLSDDLTRDAVQYARSVDRSAGIVSVHESAHYAQEVIVKEEAANGKIGHTQKRNIRMAINGAFSRINAQIVMVDPNTSLRTLFALHDPINGTTNFSKQQPVYDVATSLDFIVGELGVDGAKTIQTFEPKT